MKRSLPQDGLPSCVRLTHLTPCCRDLSDDAQNKRVFFFCEAFIFPHVSLRRGRFLHTRITVHARNPRSISCPFLSFSLCFAVSQGCTTSPATGAACGAAAATPGSPQSCRRMANRRRLLPRRRRRAGPGVAAATATAARPVALAKAVAPRPAEQQRGLVGRLRALQRTERHRRRRKRPEMARRARRRHRNFLRPEPGHRRRYPRPRPQGLGLGSPRERRLRPPLRRPEHARTEAALALVPATAVRPFGTGTGVPSAAAAGNPG